MKNNNICKFSSAVSTNELSVSCFVLETNTETMQKETRLSSNRLILVEQGEGEMLFDSVPYSFSPGTLLFGLEGERFSLLHGENVRYMYINFTGARAVNLCIRFGITSKCRKFENFNSLVPFVKDSLLSTKQETIDIAAEGILLYVLSRLSKTDKLQNDTIQKIIEITEESFCDSALSLSVIAKEIGYTPKYLSSFFKEKMHISYSEYLRSFRLKHAISLFELGLSSVKNVAILSGFSDPLYFSTIFKKYIGISPKDFSKRCTEGLIK